MREQGRDDGFREFVGARRPALVRLAALLAAGDAHLAEDLVQTALTKLYVAWPRVRATDGPEPYARRILVNALLDERRRPWRHEIASAVLPDGLRDAVDGPDGAAIETRDRVRSALAALPAGMRAAVVLRHWLGYDVVACARAMGCSEGTVKSQTARGLDRLREVLVDDITVETTVGRTP